MKIAEHKDRTEYFYSDDAGEVSAVVYQLFPGIEFVYISVHRAEFDFCIFEKCVRKKAVRIHYCKEGRMEQELSREFLHLMPGDCFVAVQGSTKERFHFPLKHYHGISIRIDLTICKGPVIDYLESCGYAPAHILQHICGNIPYTVLRSTERMKDFFDSLYEVKEKQCLDYLRMKLPELFYLLTQAKTDNGSAIRKSVSGNQVVFVKKVARYISENINDKITVKRLTKEFGVSDTYLQNAFRGVYDMPVISFIRIQKMQSAAQVLICTERTIDEVAEEFGYESESKFSAAFKRIMGEPPGVFRKAYSKGENR